MSQKMRRMTKGQIEYEYAVAMNKLIFLGQMAQSEDAKNQRDYLVERECELMAWIDVLKTAYMEYNEDVADIPF